MFEQGTILQNRYEIIEEVGTGGMSIVYKAKCHVLNRYVAIKVLKPEFADDTSFVNKFRIEAQSAAGLTHPNIVNVYDVGEENGFYYIVMELVEGITLKEYIQQNGRLPYQTALDFIMQICSGIEKAHEHHTIHRDIKPQNIIVSRSGTLKVTDFGIAKAATTNTIASSAMGSVHYISPEQARGGYSDERSDIYSLGVTLYEMLTGRVPFEGENNVTVALMHIQSEMIPPREYYPDIPVGLERIVMKATQKKPERRYLTASAMLADLKLLAVNPNADVGNTSGLSSTNAPTIQITEEEMAAINRGVSEGISVFPVTPKPSELDEANAALESLYQEEEEEEEDMEEDFEEDDPKIQSNPKLEKIITISAIFATVIIAIIIIVAIVSISNSLRGPKQTTEEPTTTEEAVQKMIDVLGYTEEQAIQKLDEAGISYVIERDYSDSFDEGTVMSQSIAEGVVLTDTDKVTIVVSKGMEMVEVPDVLSHTQDEAKVLLTSAGFEVEIEEEFSEEVEEGMVISQNPTAPGKAGKGSTVKLIVSKGKEIKRTTIPNLKKMTVSEAEAALSEANLRLGNVTQEYSDSVKEGKVISQSPASGEEVDEDTKIDITISKGKKPSPKYVATLAGAIINNGFTFETSGSVYVTVSLNVNGANYNLVSNYYSPTSFPLDCTGLTQEDLSSNENVSLTYSVKDEFGNDVTGSFSSTVQATIKEME